MAKAIVCVGSTQTDGTISELAYTVTVLGPPTYSYGSTYVVNTTISLNNNLIAWRNKVIEQAAERGVTLLAADVIVFGGPV
ncbi:hypothetical protein HOO68_05865 [Candidatus Gracilibacteria bacterium]|nr:hypothetical protein [Candidatus Gracilibacteria bacterium]